MSLGPLVRKELLAHLLSRRLSLALIFAVILGVLTTLVGSLEYSERVRDYEDAVRQQREALSRVTVYGQLDLLLLFPPQPLSVLCRGISEAAGLTAGIWVAWRPFPPAPLGGYAGAGGDAMRTLVQVDFAAAVGLVLSFLAVALGFDGICGERERGTLRQLLACPVPRGRIVLAKWIGGWLVLWLSLALAMGLGLVVLQANPAVHFAAEDWVRLILLLGLSCAFLAQVHAFSLMVSVFTRRSSTALALCLFAWLTGGVGYASVLPSLVRYGVREEPTYEEIWTRIEEISARYLEDLAAWEAANPAPPPAYLQVWEQDRRMRYGHPVGYAWRQRRNAHSQALLLASVDERQAIWSAHLAPLAREARLVDAAAILSPLTNYQVLACRLARTTVDDRLALQQVAEQRRRDFLAFLQERDAFADRRWLTDDPVDQEPMIPHPEQVTPGMLMPDAPYLRERLQWAQEQERRAADQTWRALDLAGIERLTAGTYTPLARTLSRMIPGLAVLVLTTGLALVVTLWRFQRYDPQ
ncbi:MAG: ABC transporter permease subunit [Candidatus Latescibacterota bacterium]